MTFAIHFLYYDYYTNTYCLRLLSKPIVQNQP